MHERRTAIFAAVFALTLLWAVAAWVVAMAVPAFEQWLPLGTRVHQFGSLGVFLVAGALLLYDLKIRDKADDKLAQLTLGHYFEQDGLCFMPLVRVRQRPDQPPRAEISLYYQNRFSGVCEAVIHLRPPEGSFYSHQGARDVHFAFRCAPGAFGVIHQPVGVRPDSQGEALEVKLAAAVRWPRSRGDQVRRRKGTPVGSFDVDWALAYRQSRHELCGEIQLHNPVTVHLSMPQNVNHEIQRSEFMNETIEALSPAG